ncbi:MAG TPA: type IV secretory system conjugative DNA transfer family protein [Bryobacteraceae bacterium]|jgi:type IV secretion system protein VirD4|nr:type IV secretory system conjugative DNA transfer family protein [Bryobacteraceae bacterium]
MNAYRTPRDPGGFPFGYDWRSTLVGFIALTLINAAATQYVASRFRYQEALGKPLVKNNEFAIYQPFAWCLWGFRNCTNRDERVRKPLFQAEIGVFCGSMVSLLIFIAAANRRAQRLSESAEDLHGSARWAKPKDIDATGLAACREGVYVGGWYDTSDERLVYLRHNGSEHVLAFAPTRSGKGVGLVIPTLLSWSESAIIYDIKGENFAKTAGFRTQRGQICFKFSPVEENSSSRFNPLAEIRLFTPRDVSDAQNIADMIIRSGEDSPMERHWEDTAASLTTGMILHVCYDAANGGRVASLADLARNFTRPGIDFRETLNEMLSYPHDSGFKRDWRTTGGLQTATHPVVSEKAQEMLDKDAKELSGVLSTAKTALALFSDPLVARNTSASDFKIDDLVNFERPVSLYLVVPSSDKIRLRRLIRLIFTMVVNRLTERMAFDGSEQRRNRHRLLFLIDEFPSLNRMEIFADALSYMAGYGLKAYLITQDIRQVVDAYGQNESIVSNCHVRIAYAPNQVDTAELLSKMTGTTTVQKASFNYSGSRFSPVMSHMNGSVEHIERPLMNPDEVMRLRPPQKSGSGAAEQITAPGDMLIFISGHFPILGMQMLYFFDPELKRRSSIPPPISLFGIENRRVIQQKAVAKTVNVISRPEEALIEEPMSPLEQGFLEELRSGD